MADTVGPLEPSVRFSMTGLLRDGGGNAANDEPDMRLFDYDNKIDNYKQLVHYIEQ
jgi:hypothetical protein